MLSGRGTAPAHGCAGARCLLHPRRLISVGGGVPMLRRLYDWTIRLAASPNALPTLGVVSFVESSFFPIPPDAMIIPMVLARPERAWTIALVATVTSVIGGMLGYAIGYYLFETIG